MEMNIAKRPPPSTRLEHFVYVVDHFVYDQAEADKLNAMNDGRGFQPWGELHPGDVVYKGLNQDGKIDDYGDRTHMGFPRTTGNTIWYSFWNAI
ncbi:MAG: hypothetical protein ACLRS8_13125 [Parabacteroides merdae]